MCTAGSGTAARQALSSPQPPPAQAVLSILLNEISASPQEIILALDDYHVLHNPQVQRMGGFLLNNLPARLHLVLITRDLGAKLLAIQFEEKNIPEKPNIISL